MRRWFAVAAIGINLAAPDDNSDPDEYFITGRLSTDPDYVDARDKLNAFFALFGRTNILPGCGSIFITECGEIDGTTGDPATSTSTADRVFSRFRYFINSGGATVATLIYLAAQIRQNTNQLKGESIREINNTEQELVHKIRDNPEMFSILMRTLIDWDSVSAKEQARTHLYLYSYTRWLETCWNLCVQKALDQNI